MGVIKKNYNVVQSNALIEARYTMTVPEIRIFLLTLTQIQRDDDDFELYRIRVRDLIDASGNSSESIYNEMDELTNKLMQRYLTIRNGNKFKKIAFASYVEYDGDKGEIEFRPDPALKPHLIDLKKQFTIVDIRNVLALSSTHYIRIYQLLKQYENIPTKERIIDVNELKEMLGLKNQYKNFSDFERFVLLRAQKSLTKKCDITFEFERIKKGRKVIAIKFFIKRLREAPLPKVPPPTLFDDIEATPAPSPSPVIDALLFMGIEKPEADKLATKLPKEVILNTINYVKDKDSKGEVDRPKAYLLKTLKSGGVIPSEYEIEKLNQQESERPNEPIAPERIQNLKSEYNQYRQDKVEKIYESASEADWESFRETAILNPKIRSKVFLNGEIQQKNPETISWFKTYLDDQYLPHRDAGFIKWAQKTHGYRFRITSNQLGEELYFLKDQ